jgi:sn-glycerol 3-phosphate transport system substrate-binding protein
LYSINNFFTFFLAKLNNLSQSLNRMLIVFIEISIARRKTMKRLVLLGVLLTLLALTGVAQEPTEVRVWIAFTDTRLDWARQVAADFSAEHPEYNVVVEGYANYEEILDATVLAIEQGNPPAVVQWFEVGTQFARDSGYFRPVEEAIAGRTEIVGVPVNLDDFIAPVRSYYTVEGVFTSMPWNSSSPILYSNTAMLEAAGVEGIPATWAEIEAACEKIMAMEGAPAACITWPNHGWFFEQWLAQQDTPIVNNDNGRSDRASEVILDSDAALATATWWQNMYTMGYYSYTGVQRDWSGTEQALQSASVAMIITSSADAANIGNAAAENGIEIVTSRMPYNQETGWTGNLIGGASLWLSAGLDATTEDGALAFMLYLNNTENAADWHRVTGYLPITTSAAALLEEEGWFEENPNFRTAYDQINDSTVTVATQGGLFGTFVETRDFVTQAMEDLMLAGGNPADVLAAAAAEANGVLEEYNLLYVTE